MTTAALAAARVLWPAFRRIIIRIGRWMARRLKRHGAKWLADRMEKRALGFQTGRFDAAVRRGDKVATRFRSGQMKRWLFAAKWLRDNARKLGRAIGRALDALAWEKRIPMTIPGEGRL